MLLAIWLLLGHDRAWAWAWAVGLNGRPSHIARHAPQHILPSTRLAHCDNSCTILSSPIPFPTASAPPCSC